MRAEHVRKPTHARTGANESAPNETALCKLHKLSLKHTLILFCSGAQTTRGGHGGGDGGGRASNWSLATLTVVATAAVPLTSFQ